MNANPNPIVIQDENENKLAEASNADMSAESVSTEANTNRFVLFK